MVKGLKPVQKVKVAVIHHEVRIKEIKAKLLHKNMKESLRLIRRIVTNSTGTCPQM